MNAEFVEKMLEAKRLETEALGSLVPSEVRHAAACAVRLCAETALAALDDTGEQARTARGSRPIKQPARSPRAIIIE